MYNCKNCCFAKIEDGHQEKCLADKYKYLQNDTHVKTEDGIFTYDRLCLYKRDDEWQKNKTVQEKLELARDQLFPNIGVCIDDDSKNLDDLENIIDQISNVDYPVNKIAVVIYSTYNKSGARIPKLLSKLRVKKILCHAVFIVEDNIFENETSVFKKLSDATFLTKISSKTKVNLQKSLDEINKKSNDELKRILVFKNEDALFINKTYVSRFYLEYLDYNKMQDAIFNKVIDTEFLHTII
jgi:hypothetical protein